VSAPVLSVRDLVVRVDRGSSSFRAVDGISFDLEAGSALGLVGESGSGKSLALRAMMALTPRSVSVESGTVLLDGVELPLHGREARRSRRGRMAMVFQDPGSALDPVQRVGDQIAEVPQRVLGMSRARSRDRAVELLGLVGIPDPARRAHAYPHQLSGGMRQRVVIATALATDPSVLLCDEPTTALDVTVQAQVLDLIDEMRSRLKLALVFVSHDLAVVRQLCENLAVMYTGRLVETGPTEQVLARPLHPYTLGLLDAIVDLDDPIASLHPIPGALPDVTRLPSGCTFHPRCPFATAECVAARPPLAPLEGVSDERETACFHADQLALA
jgi:oligopeptide/dipeptide ABC transporter ATP-binding protein